MGIFDCFVLTIQGGVYEKDEADYLGCAVYYCDPC
jgi:hypothetical protein